MGRRRAPQRRCLPRTRAYRRLRRRGPLGFLLNKQQWLGRFAGGLSYESFALDELKTRFYGDAAVATCRQKQAGEFKGNDVGGEFRATLVLVEGDGGWLLAGWHASPIAGPPSFLNR